MLFMWQCRKI